MKYIVTGGAGFIGSHMAEEYKSALERKDYESAKMYALELEKYRLQLIEAKNKATVGKLGIMGQIGQMLPRPERPAQPKEVSFKDQFTLNKEVLELAMPEIQRLEKSYRDWETDRKSTRLNSSHSAKSRMPSSA